MSKDSRRFNFGLFFGVSAVLVLIVALIYQPVDNWRYRPAKSFDTQLWNKPDLKYRYSTVDYLIREVLKPGLAEAEVQKLLGTPNAITADDDWQYETQKPGWRFAN